MWTIRFVLILSCLSFIRCDSECNAFRTCGQCVGYGGTEKCVWCEQETVDTPRCQPESYLENKREGWCKAKFVQNPQSAKDIEVNDDFGTKDNVTIQFRPQVIRIKTRPGVPMNFNMMYKPAQDFPLDVYYLMDNSDTMKAHKDALVKQAFEIYKQLVALTNNVQLGVGTFVEKPAYPYFDKNRQKNCQAFINVLPLTKNMEQFQHEINNIPFGANFDDMEAGLDALMQAMVCENDIGWRNGSRRIIVLCTDSPYHSAGDGKMLGIIKPNDMACHLENQTYKYALNQDYPSVSQINRVANLGRFSIIFAGIAAVRGVYTNLANQIIGANYAELKKESNIVDIIKKAYIDSVQTIKLNYDVPSFIQLKLDQDCESKIKRNCASSISEPVVTIPATLKVLNCPEGNKHYELSISPVTLKDKLTIKLDVICNCECEVENEISSTCNNEGYIQCGVCKCVNSSYGDNCQCNSRTTGSVNKEDDYNKCLKNPDKDIYVCSHQGECICGTCQCNKDYSGKHCEYYDKSCPSSDHKLCSGHGNCTLGSCHCNGPWTGPDCSCSTKNDGCKAPYSEEICSGNGNCVCGKCNCSKIEGKDVKYTGALCDICDDCKPKYCKTFENYAECNYINGTDYCKTAFNETDNIDVQLVNKTEINSIRWRGAAWCKKMLEDGSFMIFRYSQNEKTRKLDLVIQKEAEAPPIANKWIALASSIAIIVLIGLLTLIIWKILVDLHDKREYAKFEEESRTQGYDVSLNPLYERPAVNFSNPLYNSSIH